MIDASTLDLWLCDMSRLSPSSLARFLESVPSEAITWNLHPYNIQCLV